MGEGEGWAVFLISNFESDDPFSRTLVRKIPNAVIPHFLRSVNNKMETIVAAILTLGFHKYVW